MAYSRAMLSRMSSLVLLVGCAFEGRNEIELDAAVTPPDACIGFSSQLDTCALPAGTPLSLAGTLHFNTGTGKLTDAGAASVPVTSVTVATLGADVQAIVATTVTFAPGTILRATGPRPLAIIATDAIELQPGAMIDLGAGGAGARPSCAGGPVNGENDDDGAAGGGGGAFGADGGKGGDGDLDGGGSTGGLGGTAASVPAGPVGGCRGANGGNSEDLGGLGGEGGGAVYVLSATQIEIAESAGLHAGGGGGGGGARLANPNGDAGGGGGGSGGMILLEAPRVRSAGILAANGGGGGEASGDGDAGNPGDVGPLGMERASGGSGGSPTGTNGGAGGHRDLPPGDPVMTQQNGGGGGGGGGVGIIRIMSPDAVLGALVSPDPS